MNLLEAKELLAEIAVIDHREISDEAVAIWQGILATVPLEIALEAHRICRQDETIRWLEPKHIYAQAKKAAERLIAEEQRQKAKEEAIRRQHDAYKPTPMPICKHGKGLIYCGPCCHVEGQKAGLIPMDRPYAPKPPLV